jgi:hypothetical protein
MTVTASPAGAAGGRFAGVLFALEAALTFAALGGAVTFWASPHDAMPADILARTPFSSWVWSGVLLAVCVAVPAGIVAVGTIAGRAWAHPGHVLLGLDVIGWIVVQVIVIGFVAWLQPVILAWSLAITGLGALNYRQWHLSWGATAAESVAAMPGDSLISEPHFAPTRSITIAAPPTAVWPWIVQMGYGRAGWYSYDRLDNAGRRSASVILPQYQHPEVGDAVPMTGRVNDVTAFRVESFTPGVEMLWAKPDATWAWLLRATGDGGTRLVTRVRARHIGPTAPLSMMLMELGDFPMMRKSLLGLKSRAEMAPVADTAGSRRRESWSAHDPPDGPLDRPSGVAVFSSGPIGDPPKPVEQTIDVQDVVDATGAREHRSFAGALRRDRLGFAERAVVAALHAPYGDFRDWDAIEAWAADIAAAPTT